MTAAIANEISPSIQQSQNGTCGSVTLERVGERLIEQCFLLPGRGELLGFGCEVEDQVL